MTIEEAITYADRLAVDFGLNDETQAFCDMTIKALEQTRWIPCTERLPESNEEYHTFLVTDRKGNVTLSEFYLSIKDKKPYWSGMIDAIAWMPLPEGYKAETKIEQSLNFGDQDIMMSAT